MGSYFGNAYLTLKDDSSTPYNMVSWTLNVCICIAIFDNNEKSFDYIMKYLQFGLSHVIQFLSSGYKRGAIT